MSAQNKTQRPMTSLFFLIGALAFTLSSLPGGRDASGSSSFSSVDGCDLESQLSSGNSAGCDVKTGKVSGRVDVDLVTETTGVHNEEDFSKIDQTTKQVWRVKVSNLDVAGLETDCSECDEAIRQSAGAHVDVTDLRDFKKIAAAAQELFDKQSKALNEAATAAQALAKKKADCRVDDDGNKLTSTKEILNCRMDRLNAMDDKEKAAEYYSDNIEPEIKDLAMSENSKDRDLAAKLIGPGSQLASSRNPFIRQSLNELTHFGQYSNAARMMQVRLSNPLASSAEQQAVRTQLAQMQSSWGAYFAQEGLRIQNMNSPSGFTDFDFNSSLYSDVMGQDGYSASLDNQFGYIANQHNQAINGGAAAGVTQTGGRTLHGTPTVSLGGGALNNGPILNPGQGTLNQSQFGRIAPMQQQGAPGAANGLNARRLGQPVR